MGSRFVRQIAALRGTSRLPVYAKRLRLVRAAHDDIDLALGVARETPSGQSRTARYTKSAAEPGRCCCGARTSGIDSLGSSCGRDQHDRGRSKQK